jgi:glycosidase
MLRQLHLFLFLIICRLGFAQLSTNPALPIDNKPVTITFDSSKEPRLGYFTSDLYAHTGVYISGSTDWKHVIGNWGENTLQPKLTNKGNGIYELAITPDIISFYKVPSSELIKKMNFVFRSADGKKQTNDLFIDVFTADLHVSISSPQAITVFEKNQNFQFTASSTATSDLKLFLNNQQISAQTGSSVTHNLSIPTAGNYWLKVTATQNTTTVRDSVYVCVRETATIENKPSGIQPGINYIDDKTIILAVWAPGKKHLFVTGDFNKWLPDNKYQMKQDGDYFWLKLENLTPGKEYAFQYLIDGSLKVADAYAEKILDPYDDKYISPSTYPGLMPYPTKYGDDRVSVFQTAQKPFDWTATLYSVPATSKLTIYELLIRDFTTEKTYKAVRAKLDYLKRLGINTIELMPFNEFEGNSSWGYNPNFYFAPDKAYGTKNDLKALIDECHRQGFIVIQDIVLNHSYNSSPLAKMYWNAALNRPAADNPWYNQTSPNQVYSWGNDFNHESQATKDFVDRVTRYWMTEYKVDGFRFDFTKGFTNNPGEGSNYDASRISILKRMADKIWEVNPKAIVILEHFAATAEEKELAEYKNGMLVWGNASNSFDNAAMGINDSGKSDFSWASYQQRSFQKPGVVAYLESHDEERLMYRTLTGGRSLGSYNTTEMATALDRSKLAASFFLSLTGPKMIWQFGELGYDISIDQNGRVGEKPVLWNYLNDPKRQKLFDVYSAMLRLRAQYDVFTSGKETLSVNGAVKTIRLNLNDHNILLVGNFDLTLQATSVTFQHTGKWFEFFTGTELDVTDVNTPILISAGEYRLYSDKKLPAFKELATELPNTKITSKISIYPNPANELVLVQSSGIIKMVEILSIEGKLLQKFTNHTERIQLEVGNLSPGTYLIRVQTSDRIFTEKLIRR